MHLACLLMVGIGTHIQSSEAAVKQPISKELWMKVMGVETQPWSGWVAPPLLPDWHGRADAAAGEISDALATHDMKLVLFAPKFCFMQETHKLFLSNIEKADAKEVDALIAGWQDTRVKGLQKCYMEYMYIYHTYAKDNQNIGVSIDDYQGDVDIKMELYKQLLFPEMKDQDFLDEQLIPEMKKIIDMNQSK